MSEDGDRVQISGGDFQISVDLPADFPRLYKGLGTHETAREREPQQNLRMELKPRRWELHKEADQLKMRFVNDGGAPVEETLTRNHLVQVARCMANAAGYTTELPPLGSPKVD